MIVKCCPVLGFGDYGLEMWLYVRSIACTTLKACSFETSDDRFQNLPLDSKSLALLSQFLTSNYSLCEFQSCADVHIECFL